MKTGYDKRMPSLDRPATYEIKVPGELDESWSDWICRVKIAVAREGDGSPVTILTGDLDQAALQSVLRRLYSLGLPLISVICIECGPKDGKDSSQL